jgi:putative tricarboxylic transport membrane protein
MITRRDALKTAGALGLVAVLPEVAFAQSDYPAKPIELVVPFAPGGGLDLFGRTVARVLNDEKIVPQHIEVTNLPGAGGALGMAEMVKRNDDSYSLCALALHAILTPLTMGTPYSYKDMTCIAKLYSEYDLMVVRTESPIKSLKEVADAIAKDPGSVSFGGATIGNSDQITVCKLAQSVGADPTKLTYVAYSGGESNAAILGGHVDVGLGGPDLMDLVDGGKMRVLGVTAEKRLAGRMKDVPTFKEQGYDVVFQSWRALFAPPHMPAEVVTYWQDALQKMIATDAWKAELEKNQWDSTFDTGDHFRASLDAQYDDLNTLLKSLGLVK